MFLVTSLSFVINTMLRKRVALQSKFLIYLTNWNIQREYEVLIKFKILCHDLFQFSWKFPLFSCSLFFICIRKGSFLVQLTSLNLAFYSFLAFYSPLNPPSSLPPLLVNCSCSIRFNCFVHARIHQDFACYEF